MSGTFAPAPGAAPLLRMVTAQAAMEVRLLLRNGEQLVLALVIPVLVLTGGVAAMNRLDLASSVPAVDLLTPGVLALAVMSTAFTSLAIATGFERRYGVLKRLGASPLPRSGLLLGKIGALLVVETLQVVLLGGLALMLGWHPQSTWSGGAPAAVLALALGTAAFAALGMVVAGLFRAEATLAVANLIYVLLAAGGAVVLPVTAYGEGGELLRWLPSGALGESLRVALIDGRADLTALATLLGWALGGVAVAAKTFRWE